MKKVTSAVSMRTMVALTVLGLIGFSACTESFEERCRREAREYNEKQCPRRLDDLVTIDSMAYIEQPQGFAYYYTVDYDSTETELFTDSLKELFIEQLHQNVRNDIKMKTYKEKGFTFSYTYFSRATGDVLMQAAFGPEDYR